MANCILENLPARLRIFRNQSSIVHGADSVVIS